MYFYQYNDNSSFVGTNFTNNFALYGGGLYFTSYNNNASFVGTSFTGNTAENDGGGLYFNEYNTNATLIDCIMIGNYALYGSGLYLNKNGNDNLSLLSTSFSDMMCVSGCAAYIKSKGAVIDKVIVDGMNSKSSIGAGIFLGSGFSNIIVSNSIFRNNTGQGANGLAISSGSNLQVLNCLFENIRITSKRSVGAAFGLIEDISNVFISDSVFIGNIGNFGGALSVGFNCHNITLIRCKFSSNSAYLSGGAIYMQSSNSNVSIVDSVFEKNYAYFDGGAIYIDRDISDIAMTNVSFVENKAGRDGGALFLLIYISNVFLAGCNFKGNIAIRDGGAYLLDNFVKGFSVYDLNANKDFQMIETAHPYNPLSGVCSNNNSCTDQIIFAQNYSMTTGTNILIVFDTQSETSDNDRVNIYDSYLKQRLLFTNYGSSGWPGSDMPALKLSTDHFYIELIGTDGNSIPKYGFRIWVYPYFILSNISSTSNFVGNVAGRNGGVGAINYESLSLIMLNALLEGNSAEYGGAFYYNSLNSGVTIQSCLFTTNKAIRDGGSLYLSSSNFGISIEDSNFVGGIASGNGGGLFASSSNGKGRFVVNNEISFSRVGLYNNTASQGGAIYVFSLNNISFGSLQITENRALVDGGGIYFYKGNEAFMNGVVLTKNLADQRGGGISSIEENIFRIKNISFLSNEAILSGGAMLALNETLVTFSSGSIVFEDNRARLGGALLWQSSQLWELETNITIRFQGNKAVIGSAIAFADVYDQEDRQIHNLELFCNVATYGGTIFWLYNPESTSLQEPRGLNDSSNIWVDNEAPYAAKYGTQTASISNPSIYDVEVYETKLTPPITFDCLDYYGAKVSTDNTTLSEASVVSYECFGKTGVITGELITNSVTGTITFDDISAFCYPNGNLTIKFQVNTLEFRFFDLQYPWRYIISNNSLLNFRSCIAGERLIQGSCIECVDSYLFKFDPETQICETCPVEAEECHGSTISLNSGYWRRSNVSDAIFECSYGSSACIGGNATGTDLCAEGHGGVLCETCAEGYFLNSESLECELCEGLNIFTPAFIFTSLSIFLLLFGFAYYKYRNVNSARAKVTINDKFDDDSNIKKSYLMAYWEERFGPIMSKFKVITSTFQIVSASSSVLQIKMPESFTSFIQALKVFDFNIISIMPFSCVSPTDYVDTLMFSTLWPLMFGALLFIIFVGHFLWERRTVLKSNDKKKIGLLMYRLSARLRVKYFTLFLLLTYFILPSVTTSIFAMFPCINVDPDAVDDLDDYYLIADTSISCTSPRYFLGVTYAAIFILIYPIGIPFLYYYLLNKKKEEIKSRNNINPNTLRNSVKMLEFLYKSYKPSAWYFEVVETFRRLFLTAFISVIAAGTPAQAILAMVATLIFMRLYVAVNPFPSDDERLMSEAGQYQIYITFLAALIIQNNLLGTSVNELIGILLILVNNGVLVFSVYFEIQSLRETKAGDAEEGKVEKREFSSNRNSDILQGHRKDTLNPMVSLHENGIELAEIKPRENVLEIKKCDEDKDKKRRESSFELEVLYNTNHVSESSNISSKPANVIDAHKDIEKGSGLTTILHNEKNICRQDLDEKSASNSGNTVKRILGRVRDQPADSDDEF